MVFYSFIIDSPSDESAKRELMKYMAKLEAEIVSFKYFLSKKPSCAPRLELARFQLVTHGRSYLPELNKTQIPIQIILSASCSGRGARTAEQGRERADKEFRITRAVKRERNNLNKKTQTAVAVLEPKMEMCHSGASGGWQESGIVQAKGIISL